LVVMLPHGMEGQGPEHSSARLERFLQLFAEDNLQVVNVTTPANHFHVLRRQLCRDFRKPLILMDPKSLLRHKRCVSTLGDMGPDTTFHRVMADRPASEEDAQVERVVLCSGKVYYDLEAQREELGLTDKVALIRLEQLAPFPEDAVLREMKRYPTSAKYIWCQEESRNNGAWFFVMPRIENLMESVGVPQRRLIYAGRKPSASPATGSLKQHEREQAALVSEALTG
jgi:2-oxoglutarate dehydrogenase E1 component